MGCCKKSKESTEERSSPPQYITQVSVKDRIFFIRLLLRWSGSIWKMLWIDLLVFIILYIAINLMYHFVISNYPIPKKNFEKFVNHVKQIASSAPLSFLLGFFVSAVLGRWWSICMTIPWLSQPSVLLNSYINPPDKKQLARKVRLNLLRYMNLAWIFAMKSQSVQIFKRFRLPGEVKNDFEKFKNTMENIFLNKPQDAPTKEPSFRRSNSVENIHNKVESRLRRINEDSHVKKNFGYLISMKEIQIFKEIAQKENDPNYLGEYWIPLQWCTRILVKARQANLIIGDFEFSELIKIVDGFRGALGTLFVYSEVNVPLVYTQVIIVAVYSFFLAEVFSSQLIQAGETTVTGTLNNSTSNDFNQFDNYIPIFSIFKFIFFMGWFKTAASLLNPLGDDSHDLPTSLMLDFNLMISIKSGDASDDMFPDALTYEGDPEQQLSLMDELPKGVTIEELDIEDSGPTKESEKRHLKAEIA